jgi:hypothetical protein
MEKLKGYQKLKENLSDQTWRLNNLYWIINEKSQRVKFKMNFVQRALYTGLWYLSIILKSRQHGVTTFFCIYFLDVTLFNSNIRAGIIAHNREDAESFFKDKIKYAYDNLPESIRAERPARTDSARELAFSNNSAIRVGTSMRSATLQYLHVSEFGKICRKYPEKAKEIKTGSLNTVHAGQFIAIESTAEGNEGDFYDFCQEAKKKQLSKTNLTPLDFKFFFFPWYQDPRNQLKADGVIIPSNLENYFDDLLRKHSIELTDSQKAWYAKKWTIQGEDMKREHPSTPDEAFEARIEGAYFSSQFKRVYAEKRILLFPREDGIPVETWWDLGMNDTTVIWFTQTVAREIRVIHYYENSGEGLAHYADYLNDRADEGYRFGKHTAPHDISVRELGTGKTRLETAKKYGINFEPAEKLPKDDQIAAARDIIQYCYFHEKECARGIKALENYRKKWDDEAGCYKNKPHHNWASNGADAFQVMAVAHEFKDGTGHFTPNRRAA